MTTPHNLPAWGMAGVVEVRTPIVDVSEDGEFTRLLDDFPPDIREIVRPRIREVEEVTFKLGQRVEVAYRDLRVVYNRVIESRDLMHLDTGGLFRADGRRGIEGTLHRISRFTDISGDENAGQSGKTNLIKVRVARVLAGVAEPLRDVLYRMTSGLLLVGPPGVGKTTLLRDILRILQELYTSKLFVVDTSLEICGEGAVPHPFLRNAARVMVGHPARQKAVINQTVMNGGSALLAVDEIGYRDDVGLVQWAAQRGIMPIGSVHGFTILDVVRSPTLRPLVGLRTDGSKHELEGAAFGMLIEVRGKGEFRVFMDVDQAIRDLEAGLTPVFEDIRLQVADNRTERMMGVQQIGA